MTEPSPVHGRRIQSLRLAANYTASDLADLVGVRPQVIRRLEASDSKVLTALTGQQLVDLARALRTRVDALLSSDNQGSPEPSDDAHALLVLLYGQRREVKQTLLARTLGWDLVRLAAARKALIDQLEPVNLTVRQIPTGWRIDLFDTLAADDKPRLLATKQSEIEGLDRAAAKVLYNITYPPQRGAVPGRRMGKDRLKRLSLLEKIGAITPDGSDYTASSSLRSALDM